MDLTKKQLEEIEAGGKCQFTVENVAVIIEVDPKAFEKLMHDKNSAAYKRYTKGRLQAEFEVRQSIIELANRGSSQAQELFLKLRDELKIEEA